MKKASILIKDLLVFKHVGAVKKKKKEKERRMFMFFPFELCRAKDLSIIKICTRDTFAYLVELMSHL